MDQQRTSEWPHLAQAVGISDMKIVLDHPHGVFYPGNRVTGKVHLNVVEEKSFTGLRLTCKGEGQVFFTDRSAGFRRRYSNEESYVFDERYLFGDGQSEKSVSVGANVFPFSVDLEESIPCSFEGRYGRVRYTITASLEPIRMSPVTDSMCFTVAPVLDLNKDPLATLPISESNSKAVVGHTEPLTMLVSLPVRGFVPGQTVPINAIVNNSSNVEVKKLRIIFKKVNVYHADRKSRTHKEIITEIELPVSKERAAYETSFEVPALPPTGMSFCKIIDVSYSLKVEACVEPSEWYLRMVQKNLKTRMKLYIGSIPLQHYESPLEELPLVDEKETDSTEVDSGPEVDSRTENSPNKLSYKPSQIYRSSKPNRDDPTGDDPENIEDASQYNPMYRVYTFKTSKNTPSKSHH